MAPVSSRATDLPAANGGRLSKPSLRALVARAKRGEQAAFEQIFRRYHQEIFRYCRTLLGDAAEAEDAMQSTMAAALRALPGERREIALRAWLFRIAHNEAISVLRARMPGLEAEDGFERAARAADADAAQRERLRTLVSDLNLLPERQRSALVMRELSDLTYTEIAAALDTSEAAAKQVVYEARAALRTLEEGREMGCEEARRTLSERDGRKLRGRGLRAHLRACGGCRDFRTGIERRRADLAALAPPLPAVASLGILASLLGGSAGGGAGAGGATVGSAAAGAIAGAGGASTLAGGAAGGAAIKGASVVAAAVLATGGAHAGGVVELPLPGGAGGESATPASPAPEPRAPVDPERSERGAAESAPASPGASARGTARRNPTANRKPARKRPAEAPVRLPPAAGLPRAVPATPPPHSRAGGGGPGSQRSTGADARGTPAGPPPIARDPRVRPKRAAPPERTTRPERTDRAMGPADRGPQPRPARGRSPRR